MVDNHDETMEDKTKVDNGKMPFPHCQKPFMRSRLFMHLSKCQVAKQDDAVDTLSQKNAMKKYRSTVLEESLDMAKCEVLYEEAPAHSATGTIPNVMVKNIPSRADSTEAIRGLEESLK